MSRTAAIALALLVEVAAFFVLKFLFSLLFLGAVLGLSVLVGGIAYIFLRLKYGRK